MKFVFYCSKFPPIAGGAGIDAYHLGIDLSAKNHQVFVVCEWFPGQKKIEQINPDYFVYRVGVPFIKNRGSALYFISLCFGIAWRGINLIIQKKVDILHCHDTATGIAGLITKFFTRIPTVFKFGGSMTYEYLCNAKQKGWDPIVGEPGAWKNAKGFTRLLLYIEKQFFIRFDRIYPIANYLVDLLKSQLNLPASKVKLIYNGVDIDRLDSLEYHNLKPSLKVEKMIFTGVRFVKYKGVDVLIKACLPILEKYKAHLVIAGEGPEKNALLELAGDHPGIRFVGNLPWEENMNFVHSADVYVLPTLLDKTPSSLMEALALGVPCITSNIDGVKELVAPGGAGLVEPGNPDALREKIEWMLQNPAKAREMGTVSRQFMKENFRWETTRNKIIELYHDIFNSRNQDLNK